MTTPIEPFSRGYVLAPTVEVNPHGGDLAIMDETVYDDFAVEYGEPVIGFVGGLHYQFAPSANVLSDRAAVPRHNHASDDSLPLLVQKP